MIDWTKLIPRWGGEVIEPPESKKDIGYLVGDKPPAKWENWLRKATYEAVTENRQQIDNLDVAVEELFTNVSDGKQVVATAITDKGVPTSGSDTFQKMATNINAIETDKTGDATAVASDILATKTAYSKGVKLIGTIPSKGVATITPTTANQTITAGQYLSGNQTIAGVTVPVSNVLTGTTIAGAAGTMPNRGAADATITTQGGTSTIASGYHSGTGKVTASFSNLVAGNIKSGVNVGGVVGNLISAEGTTYTVPVYDPTDYSHTVINYNTGYQGSGGLKADVSLTMKFSGTLAMYFDTAQSYAQFQVYKNGTLFYEFYPNTSPASTTKNISVNSGDIIRCKLTLQVSYPSDYNTILLMFNYSLEGGVTLL